MRASRPTAAPDHTAPGEAVVALVALARRLGAPSALREVGLQEDDLALAADLLVETAPHSPVPLDRDVVAGLLRRAWQGAPEVAA